MLAAIVFITPDHLARPDRRPRRPSIGRRALLLGGVAVMSLSLFFPGLAFTGSKTNTFSSVLAIVSLMTYVGAIAI